MEPVADAWLAFLRGGTDHRGRTLLQIRGRADAWLETQHDWVQWLFPLPEPSPVNPAAPLLSRAARAALATDPHLAAELRASLTRALAFYGLEHVDGEIHRAPTFPERARVWLAPGDHNHLRLTRILRCCALCGLEDEARALERCLAALAAGPGAGAISPTTLAYWGRAACGEP